jgi:adenylate kinase family enzyme
MVVCEFAFAEPDAGHLKMIVFFSGLSGVGKTTTAKAFIERYTQFKHARLPIGQEPAFARPTSSSRFAAP